MKKCVAKNPSCAIGASGTASRICASENGDGGMRKARTRNARAGDSNAVWALRDGVEPSILFREALRILRVGLEALHNISGDPCGLHAQEKACNRRLARMQLRQLRSCKFGPPSSCDRQKKTTKWLSQRNTLSKRRWRSDESDSERQV